MVFNILPKSWKRLIFFLLFLRPNNHSADSNFPNSFLLANILSFLSHCHHLVHIFYITTIQNSNSISGSFYFQYILHNVTTITSRKLTFSCSKVFTCFSLANREISSPLVYGSHQAFGSPSSQGHLTMPGNNFNYHTLGCVCY